MPTIRRARFGSNVLRSGLGLGLHIAREIVQAHGGTIATRSTVHVAVFTMAWPRPEQPNAEPSDGTHGKVSASGNSGS